MRHLILIAAIALSGCTTLPRFQGVTYEVKFGKPRPSELSSNNLAECRPGGALFPPVVILDEAQWKKLSSVSKETLMYHELGHCILHKPHGKGIMQPSLISDTEYLAHKAALLKEFFK